MPLILEQLDDNPVLRLQEACTVTCVAEVKTVILQALASGKPLRVDLEQAEEIDITLLQLLWAVEREAGRTGARVIFCASESARNAALEAGFEGFPGETEQG